MVPVDEVVEVLAAKFDLAAGSLVLRRAGPTEFLVSMADEESTINLEPAAVDEPISSLEPAITPPPVAKRAVPGILEPAVDDPIPIDVQMARRPVAHPKARIFGPVFCRPEPAWPVA